MFDALRHLAALVSLGLIAALIASSPAPHGCAGIGNAMPLGCR